MSSQTITVKRLKAICDKAIKNGLGDRKILISSDDEGNEYHELFFALSDCEDVLTESGAQYVLPYGVTYEEAIKDYIILG
jgi:hypothetical protein